MNRLAKLTLIINIILIIFAGGFYTGNQYKVSIRPVGEVLESPVMVVDNFAKQDWQELVVE